MFLELTSDSAFTVAGMALGPATQLIVCAGMAFNLPADVTNNELQPTTNVFCSSSRCINACCSMLGRFVVERINCDGAFPVATVFSNMKPPANIQTIYCYLLSDTIVFNNQIYQKQIICKHLSTLKVLSVKFKQKLQWAWCTCYKWAKCYKCT